MPDTKGIQIFTWQNSSRFSYVADRRTAPILCSETDMADACTHRVRMPSNRSRPVSIVAEITISNAHGSSRMRSFRLSGTWTSCIAQSSVRVGALAGCVLISRPVLSFLPRLIASKRLQGVVAINVIAKTRRWQRSSESRNRLATLLVRVVGCAIPSLAITRGRRFRTPMPRQRTGPQASHSVATTGVVNRQ
jgi:hypothetical protein